MTPEQENFFRAAVESIRDAEILLQHGGRTGRSASCAYYAMFYAATALLLAAGKSPWRHKATIEAFNRDYIETGKLPLDLYRYLITASEKRTGGDYEPEYVVTSADAEAQIAHAREFVQQCEAFLKAQT